MCVEENLLLLPLKVIIYIYSLYVFFITWSGCPDVSKPEKKNCFQWRDGNYHQSSARCLYIWIRQSGLLTNQTSSVSSVYSFILDPARPPVRTFVCIFFLHFVLNFQPSSTMDRDFISASFCWSCCWRSSSESSSFFQPSLFVRSQRTCEAWL